MKATTAGAIEHPYPDQDYQPKLLEVEPVAAPAVGEVDQFGEVWVRTPQQHGRLLHGEGKGIVSLAQRLGNGHWYEKRYPVEVAIEVLRHYQGRRDVYLSQQRFRSRRRIAQLLSLSSLYTDLDYYGTEYEGLHPYALLEVALEKLEKAGIPYPTIAISSGRGIYLIWQMNHLKRSALPRWNACQRHLVGLLKGVGADAAAKDCTRVLRVVGTRHRSADMPVESLLPVGKTYDFDELANRILPLTTGQLHDLRVQRALRRARSPQERKQEAPEGFTSATLWEARLTDLQRLRELRFMEYQMADYRHRWLWIAGAGMSWLAKSPQAFRDELVDLAQEAGGWREEKTRRDLGSVIRTTEAAFRREKTLYGGIERDPRFRFLNQTIIDLLEIDASEEAEMKTIISDDTRRKRDAFDKERKRREAGALTRQQYEGRAHQRREEARRLATEGMTRPQIAEVLKVSRSTVDKALKGSA